MSPPSPISAQRHYGLDWLRIAAFGLLIVYHVAMVFSPWDWVVKWPRTYPALVAPMAALTPWRLPLLFAVSGFATARLLARRPALPAFVRARSARLLIPVAFALALLLPPELWIRERLTGYPESLASYWLGDYWSLSPVNGFAFPNWEHLWFVVYLWAYTLVLVSILATDRGTAIDRGFFALREGWRLLWIPAALLIVAKLALMFVVPEQQGLTTDWAGHAAYLPIFLFGAALGRSDALWPAIARVRHGAAALAAVSGVIVVAIELAFQGQHVPGHAVMAIDRAARLTMAWGMILLLFHVANCFWNVDHPLRPILAEAIFPAYIVHHPVLVLLAWAARDLPIGPVTGFLLLLSGMLAACLAFGRLQADRAELLGRLQPRLDRDGRVQHLLLGCGSRPQCAKANAI